MSSGTKIPFFSSLEFSENTSAIPLSQKIALCHRWGGCLYCWISPGWIVLTFPKVLLTASAEELLWEYYKNRQRNGKKKGKSCGFLHWEAHPKV